jgi:2-dehydro-3-deoxyglucarate aldolase/4-hydroxy-2-oxoheptanedioate aldolase
LLRAELVLPFLGRIFSCYDANSSKKQGFRHVTLPALAFWLERPNIAACEIAQLIGYKMVVLDLEHGAIGDESCDAVVALSRAIGLTCIVRVAAPTRLLIQQALDYGADGVMLPQLENLAHAREACAFAKFPPLGTRGVGYSRIMKYGAYTNVDDGFFAAENKRTLCYPMIETVGALGDVEEIAALATVDGLFVGPSDLSMSRGRGSFKFSQGDIADFIAVATAAKANAKGFGLPAPGAGPFALAAEQGATFVTVCDDITALRVGFESGLQVAKNYKTPPAT